MRRLRAARPKDAGWYTDPLAKSKSQKRPVTLVEALWCPGVDLLSHSPLRADAASQSYHRGAVALRDLSIMKPRPAPDACYPNLVRMAQIMRARNLRGQAHLYEARGLHRSGPIGNRVTLPNRPVNLCEVCSVRGHTSRHRPISSPDCACWGGFDAALGRPVIKVSGSASSTAKPCNATIQISAGGPSQKCQTVSARRPGPDPTRSV